jgi:hypothetical protein
MKFMNVVRSKAAAVRAAVLVAVVSAPMLAHAQSSGTSAPDFTTLLANIDFSTVITAVMSIAALVAGVYLAISGAKIVLRMVRSA